MQIMMPVRITDFRYFFVFSFSDFLTIFFHFLKYLLFISMIFCVYLSSYYSSNYVYLLILFYSIIYFPGVQYFVEKFLGKNKTIDRRIYHHVRYDKIILLLFLCFLFLLSLLNSIFCLYLSFPLAFSTVLSFYLNLIQ